MYSTPLFTIKNSCLFVCLFVNMLLDFCDNGYFHCIFCSVQMHSISSANHTHNANRRRALVPDEALNGKKMQNSGTYWDVFLEMSFLVFRRVPKGPRLGNSRKTVLLSPFKKPISWSFQVGDPQGLFGISKKTSRGTHPNRFRCSAFFFHLKT